MFQQQNLHLGQEKFVRDVEKKLNDLHKLCLS